MFLFDECISVFCLYVDFKFHFAERIPDERLKELIESPELLRKYKAEMDEKYRFAPYRSKTPPPLPVSPLNRFKSKNTNLKRKRHTTTTTETDLVFKRLKIMEFLSKPIDTETYHDLARLSMPSPPPSTSSSSGSTAREFNYSDTDKMSSLQCVFDELLALHSHIHKKETNDDLPRAKNTYEEDFVVEKIVKINEVKGSPSFFVKWKNYPPEQNTWEPIVHVEECKAFSDFMVKQYRIHEKVLDKVWHSLTPTDISHLNDTEIIRRISEFHVNSFQAELLLLAVFEYNKLRAKGKYYEMITAHVQYGLALLPFALRRLDQLREIAKWQIEINSKDASKNLKVENNVDFEVPSTNFQYTNNVIPAEGIIIPDDPPIGCECPGGVCDSKSNCCGKGGGSKFAYSSTKSLVLKPGQPIYECNKRCSCGPDCRNRVVQQGRRHSLLIFKTSNGCGWGVKTNIRIARGQFISEYTGEVITCEEAEKRGQEYDAVGRTYLFDLDFNDNDNKYSLDAAKCGNVSRFINHSCNPNVGVWAVWADCLDLDLPRLCLFSLRGIDAGEEITFDYTNQNACQGFSQQSNYSNESNETKENDEQSGDSSKKSIEMTECKCGAPNCRKFLF